MVRIIPALGFIATIGLLLVAGDLQSRQAPGKQAKVAAKQEAKLKELDVVRQAYVLMAMANHDYGGHRHAAMKQVEEAIKLLDASIMKQGTNGQKVMASEEEIADARAKFLAKHSASVHEAQALSDLQLREAYQLLGEVHKAAAIEKQPKVKGHVDKAIHELKTALKIR